jgi:hypothetical protein
MGPLIIELPIDTPDRLRSVDPPVLRAAVEEAIEPTSPMIDGAGFNNQL